jgi:GPH family glycoside/pentoside/hexuronide:cation symporter
MALTLGQKAGWGLADLGVVVFVVVKQLLVLAFLTSYLGVPAGIAGAATTGVLVFDMITDPVIGYLSDRTDSRFGRRAPWMVAGSGSSVWPRLGSPWWPFPMAPWPARSPRTRATGRR